MNRLITILFLGMMAIIMQVYNLIILNTKYYGCNFHRGGTPN